MGCMSQREQEKTRYSPEDTEMKDRGEAGRKSRSCQYEVLTNSENSGSVLAITSSNAGENSC